MREHRYLENQSKLHKKVKLLAEREKELLEKEKEFKLEQKMKMKPLKKKSS